jgi:SAM-dependent methyltransferase
VVREESAEAVVDDLLNGAQKALVLRAFVSLGVAEHVPDGGVALAELSVALKAPASSVSRLMRAVVALGLCVEVEGGRYRLTDAGALLRRRAAGNAAGWAELMTAPWMLAAWAQLGSAVQADNTVFADIHGMGFWDYVARHPHEAGVFDQAMTSGADGRARDLLDALDWSSVGLVVDVGGGQGRLLARVLGEHPHLRGVVVDRLEVVAAPAAETRQVADRLDMAGGDFFATVPAGADVYVLSRIVHDWPDRDAIAILRTCREAMTPGSRLCLLEQVAPKATEASGEDRVALGLKDLNMLVLVGGQERSLAEYQDLLDAAGLSLARVHEGAACSVLEAAARD